MHRVRMWLALFALAALLVGACADGSSGPSSSIDGDVADEDIPADESPFIQQGLPEPEDDRIIDPYTGVELTDEALLGQPAVAVKIDNDQKAWPQIGLGNADIVFEVQVENDLTRFLAVYHSDLPENIGPSRSARESDLQLLANLGSPIFGYAGSNSGVRAEVLAARESGSVQPFDVVIDLPAAAFRIDDRPAPHNLVIRTVDLLDAAADRSTSPQQIFGYAAADAVLGQGGGVQLRYSSKVVVDYVWSNDSGTWLRYQSGRRHLDADGDHIAPTNVVVLEVNYRRSSADAASPLAITVGQGSAIVLTRGGVVRATWTRELPSDPYTLTDADGNEIGLSPGPTWVALPSIEQANVLTVSDAQQVQFFAALIEQEESAGE